MTSKQTKMRSAPDTETQNFSSLNDGLTAAAALVEQDPERAIEILTRLKAQYPHSPQPLFRASRVLIDIGREEQADQLLAYGQKRFTQNIGFVLGRAWSAHRRRDFSAALDRWAEMRSAFPENPGGYHGAAVTLRELGRIDDSEAMAATGMERFPGDPGLAAGYAQAALARRDFAEAVQRWEVVRARFPDRADGYLSAAAALQQLARFEEAEGLLQAAIERFPDYPEPLVELVELLSRLKTTPGSGKLATCANLIEAFLERHQPTPQLALAFATLAKLSRDWTLYLQRSTAAATHFPANNSIRMTLADAQELALGDNEAAEGSVAADIGSATTAPFLEILRCFESLGGAGPKDGSWGFGCEFGFFQRGVGFEPLGLLRWATINPGDLIRALETRFAGVGLPDTITVNLNSQEDWGVIDRSYNMDMAHTHLDRGTIAIEDVKDMVSRRNGYLARKLLDDLAAGDKIFVYRVFGRDLEPKALRRIVRALRTYGDNWLLYVTHGKDPKQPIGVREVTRGLLCGTMDWFAAETKNLKVNHHGWTRVCTEAIRIWTQRRGGQSFGLAAATTRPPSGKATSARRARHSPTSSGR